MHNSKNRGDAAEALALDFLHRQKLTLICRNFYCRFGEIDLIMDDGRYIIFIEVRYRKDAVISDPAETVDRCKQKKIILTSQHFLQQHQSHYPEHDYRFDVITVTGEAGNDKINWIQNAFSA